MPFAAWMASMVTWNLFASARSVSPGWILYLRAAGVGGTVDDGRGTVAVGMGGEGRTGEAVGKGLEGRTEVDEITRTGVRVATAGGAVTPGSDRLGSRGQRSEPKARRKPRTPTAATESRRRLGPVSP